MKTIETIKEEYKKYEVHNKKNIVDLIKFKKYLKKEIHQLDSDIVLIFTEIYKNKKWQTDGYIRNSLSFLFAEEDIEYYDADTDILFQFVKLANIQKSYLKSILKVSTSENFKELLKLTEFTTEYYNNHFDYIEVKRNNLELEFQGDRIIKNKYEDYREEFNEFFLETINKLTPHKVVEKIKKI